MVAPALGGGFEATLNTQNSISVGDGFEFSASVNGGQQRLQQSAWNFVVRHARSGFVPRSGAFLKTTRSCRHTQAHVRREVGEPVGDHWRRHEQQPHLLLSRGWVAGVNLSFFDDSPRGREEQ